MNKGDAIRLSAFGGLNNVQDRKRLADAELSAAVNVDIDDSGRVARRDGYTKIHTDACHSLYSDGTALYYVKGGSLIRSIIGDGVTEEVLRTGLADAEVSWTKSNGVLYWSNGISNGTINNGTAGYWGIQVPPPASVANNTSGDYYTIALTYSDASGRESPPSYTNVRTTRPFIAGMPTGARDDVTTINVYCTAPNGDTLYRVASVPVVTAAVLISGISAMTCKTEGLQSPPVGRIVRSRSGRILVAAGRTLWVSRPYSAHLFDMAREFYQFNETIEIVETVMAGYVVSADKLYLVNPEQGTISILANYRALPGGAFFVNGSSATETYQPDQLMMWTERGLCRITPDGQFANMTERKVILPAKSMASVYDVEARRAIGAISSVGLRESVTCTIRRNGVIVNE